MAERRKPTEAEVLSRALKEVFISPNVADSNWEPANVVDALDKIAAGLFEVAAAIRESSGQKR